MCGDDNHCALISNCLLTRASEDKSDEHYTPMDIDPTEAPANEEQSSDPSSSSEDEVQEVEEVDPIVAADRAKEEGNAKFKVKKYGEAIDLYTEAFSMSTSMPFL